MKKSNILWLALILFLAACGGDDNPNPTPDPDPDPEPTQYDACVPHVSENTLEIITWNIENFPMAGNATLKAVARIITEMDVDVIALQEIRDVAEFRNLIELLDGWNGHVEQLQTNTQGLGYLYKDSEISVLSAPSNLFASFSQENNDAFTSVRRPLHMKIRHTSGLEVDLINIHLKCCDGSEDRRRLASEKLKEYMDTNYGDDEKAILLGDFNDEIVDSRDNVFQNFLDDTNNYTFTTLPIALGDRENWSFPSWPSQIDQILITDDLVENEVSTQVLKFGVCVSSYSSNVSDHRPVFIGLEAF